MILLPQGHHSVHVRPPRILTSRYFTARRACRRIGIVLPVQVPRYDAARCGIGLLKG